MSSCYITLPFLAFGLTWVFIALALKTPFARHFADVPDQRKLHETPVPRIGGICIIAAFTIVLHLWYTVFAPGFAFLNQDLYYTILACVAIVLGVGFLDDSTFVIVRVRHKLAAEFLLAIAAVALIHLRFGQVVLFHDLALPFWLNDLIAVFWIVGIINALNIIDGVNGLAGGVALIGFAAIAFIGYQIDSARVVLLSLVLMASVLGFLLHNMRPSRVFLGDTGSLFLGSLLGIVSLHVINLSEASFNLPVFALIVGLPILDVLVAMVRRYFKARDRHRSILQRFHATIIPDNNHIHHRLITRGYSHLQTSLLLYAFSIMLCLGAFTMQFVGSRTKLALAGYLLFSMGIVLYRLGFGSRFFKFLRRWKRRLAHTPRPRRMVLGIVDTRGVIFHACRETAPATMQFERVNLLDMPAFGRHLSGLILCNATQTPLAQDIALARAFYTESGCPVFLLTEKVSSDFKISGSGDIYCKKMPVSIRPFLDEIGAAIAVAPAPYHKEAAARSPRQLSMETEPHDIAS